MEKKQLTSADLASAKKTKISPSADHPHFASNKNKLEEETATTGAPKDTTTSKEGLVPKIIFNYHDKNDKEKNLEEFLNLGKNSFTSDSRPSDGTYMDNAK